MDMLAPIGSTPEQVAEAAHGLDAVGKTTELYRNALQAVRMLAAYPADLDGVKSPGSKGLRPGRQR